MNTPRKITVLLADDHQIVREGLRRLLEIACDIEVVGEAINGRQAVDLTRKLKPDIVVMDIAMPQLNGLEAARQIRQFIPDAKVLLLSAHCDEAYVECVVELGVAGYLTKQSSAQVFIEAIREAQKGHFFASPGIAKSIHQNQQNLPTRKGPPRNIANLSSREVEVLQLVAEGNANKQVAAKLGLCIKTVEKHRDHLMRKLDIHDTAGLTRYAIRAGIIESSVQVTFI